MRALWKGAVSFGLVSIPVRLYAATERKQPKFNYLHEECHSPIRYRKWCPRCDREVQQNEIVRGYQYDKGQYVVLDEDDLPSVSRGKKRSVGIIDFVKQEEIDPIYYDRSYYLEPSEGGAKPYALLCAAMRETQRVALALVALRDKETLATVRMLDRDFLVMETMFYPDEVRPPAALQGIEKELELDQRELKMAHTLIDSLSTEFEPSKYRSEHRESLLATINAKVEQEEVHFAPEAEGGKVIDLMEALKESIALAERERVHG